MFAFNVPGLEGSLLMMIGHVSAGEYHARVRSAASVLRWEKNTQHGKNRVLNKSRTWVLGGSSLRLFFLAPFLS
jgi:hypothetical protein